MITLFATNKVCVLQIFLDLNHRKASMSDFLRQTNSGNIVTTATDIVRLLRHVCLHKSVKKVAILGDQTKYRQLLFSQLRLTDAAK